MKHFLAILLGLSLAACTSYPYAVKDGGDGVYYAESPPNYTYVDGYFGFPYYGPYSWAWYHPVWYSPILGHHYSWCRPYDYWCGPGHWPGSYMARHYEVPATSPVVRNPAESTASLQPILPVDMKEMVIGTRVSRSSQKPQTWAMPKAKSQAYDKSARSSYPSSRTSSSPAYRSPRAPSSSRSSSRSVRPPVVRRDSENEY